jgi:hypothetical protein
MQKQLAISASGRVDVGPYNGTCGALENQLAKTIYASRMSC